MQAQGEQRGRREKLNHLRLRLIKICRNMDHKYIILVDRCRLYFICDMCYRYVRICITIQPTLKPAGVQCILPLQTHFILLNSIFEIKCILLQCKSLAHALFIRHKVIAACYGRAAPVCLPPLLKASPFTQPSESLTGAQKHHNKERDRMEIWLPHRGEQSGGREKDVQLLEKTPWPETLGEKWRRRGMKGGNEENQRKTCRLLTYPSPNTESACGWAWSGPFLSPPCRTARPPWGPSRMMPGRRSAERLSSWRRHPIELRKKGQREIY